MSDNHNLPINVDSQGEVGTVTYANEVIAIIAGMAMYEIEGVVKPTTTSAGISELFARSNKPMTRGVKVEVGTEEASADLTMTVEYGQPVQKVATEVQENVRKAIESMTGLRVVKVDVHVVGISFEKETQEMEEGFVKATAKVEGQINLDTADVDSPPKGIDPDSLPVRNVQMNDERTGDENEEQSATLSEDPEIPDGEEW